jgi:translocator protein
MAHERSSVEVVLNGMGLLVVLVVNTLANVLPIGGQTTGEVSDNFPSTFTPAGYVFSIWGFIYLLLLGFVVWQALPRQRSSAVVHSLSKPFLLTCLANSSWIFAWHYDQVLLSFVLMIVLLVTLIHIYQLIGGAPQTDLSYWFIRLPFCVYTGWITVATLANFSALQLHFGWQDMPVGEAQQTVIKIAVAGTVAVLMLYFKRDVAFVLVVIWASMGIAVANEAFPLVQGAAAAVALVTFLLIVIERVLVVLGLRNTPEAHRAGSERSC